MLLLFHALFCVIRRISSAGTQHSTGTLEDQLAKLMGNIERLRVELLTGPTPEREEAIKVELRSRKDACKKLRAKGIIPAVGPAVFNQMDLDKDRYISEAEFSRVLKALKHLFPVDGVDKVLLAERFAFVPEYMYAQVKSFS